MKFGFRDERGFSLAELLIVVAIIGALSAVALPTFSAQMERTKQSVDLANMRNAYAAAATVYLLDGTTGVFPYDAMLGTLSVSGSTPAGYGKSTKDASDWQEEYSLAFSAAGVPNADGISRYLRVTIGEEDGAISMRWDGGGNASYLDATAPYAKVSDLMKLHRMDNSARVAADQTTLVAIGEEILNSWTLQDLKDSVYTPDGEGVSDSYRLGNYSQLKSGTYGADADSSVYRSEGFQITTQKEDSKLLSLLEAVGYRGGKVLESSAGATTYSNALFYSDELASNYYMGTEASRSSGNSKNKYNINNTERMIVLRDICLDKNGKINKLTIYTKANQYNAYFPNQNDFVYTVYVNKDGEIEAVQGYLGTTNSLNPTKVAEMDPNAKTYEGYGKKISNQLWN